MFLTLKPRKACHLETGLGDLTAEQYLALAIAAAEQLDWHITLLSANGFEAYTDSTLESPGEEIRLLIKGSVVHLYCRATVEDYSSFERNKENLESLQAHISLQQAQLQPEEIEQKVAALQLDAEEGQTAIEIPGASFSERLSELLSLFLPSTGYTVTPFLVFINVLVFLIMVFSGVSVFQPANGDLLAFGANFKPYTLGGQYWRLFTACFVHIGLLHLAMNMYALIFIGLLLEPVLGKARFLTAYLIAGLVASINSLYWNDNVLSAGASGAIFGMYGVLLSLLTTGLVHKSVRKQVLGSIVFFVIYNLAYGLKSDSGIDNAAHIGGLVSGVIIGYALFPSVRRPENRKLNYISLSLLLLIGVTGTGLAARYAAHQPSAFGGSSIADLYAYDERMKEFANHEQMALQVLNLPESTDPVVVMQKLKNPGIFYWKENLLLLDAMNPLKLPALLRQRNAVLARYCQTFISYYEELHDAIQIGNSDQLNDVVSTYNQEISLIIVEIKEIDKNIQSAYTAGKTR
jgi:rhomboid protease GluP